MDSGRTPLPRRRPVPALRERQSRGAAGGDTERVRLKTFAINDDNLLVSRVYQQQQEAGVENLADAPEDMPIPGGRGGGSYFIPLVHRGRSIGVVCLDRGRPGQFPRVLSLRPGSRDDQASESRVVGSIGSAATDPRKQRTRRASAFAERSKSETEPPNFPTETNADSPVE